MPTYTFKEADLPPGATCIDLEAKWGLERGQVVSITTEVGVVTVETLVPITQPTPEPPIVAVIDAVLKARGLVGFTAEEKAEVTKALE